MLGTLHIENKPCLSAYFHHRLYQGHAFWFSMVCGILKEDSALTNGSNWWMKRSPLGDSLKLSRPNLHQKEDPVNTHK